MASFEEKKAAPREAARLPVRPESPEDRRRLAVALLEAGWTYRRVADALSADLSSLVRWRRAYRRFGAGGLASRPRRGARPRLSQEQVRDLARLLRAGAAGGPWTLGSIAALIERVFGVRYHPHHVWRVMRQRLGWRCRKGLGGPTTWAPAEGGDGAPRVGRLALAAGLLLAAAGARADITRTLNYQGFLSDSNGLPVDAAKDMHFLLYTQAAGGSSVWDERRCAADPGGRVGVVKGRYEVEIGSNTAGGIPASVFQNNGAVWLELQVDPDDDCAAMEALLPRIRLQASPYAFKALHASTAAYVENNLDAVVRADADGNASGAVRLRVDGTDWLLVKNDGAVGVGTTDPVGPLSVAGNAGASSMSMSVFGGQKWRMQQNAGDESNAGVLDYRGFDATSLSIVGAGTGANRNVRVWDSLTVGYNAPAAGVAAFGGDVGIGTANPVSRLQVNGAGGGAVDLSVNGRIRTGDASDQGGVWLNAGQTGFIGAFPPNIGFWTQGGGWNTLQISTVTGRVGIGTTSPSQRLHVAQGNLLVDHGVAAATITLSGVWADPAGTAGMLAFRADTNKLRLNISGTGWVDIATGTIGGSGVSGSGAAGRVAFWDSAGSLSSNAKLHWDNTNARLGVGTTAPTYQVEAASWTASGCANPFDANDVMVAVGAWCVDKYEASVWSTKTGGTQYGASSDNYPCNDNGQDCADGAANPIYARSVSGVTPSRYITWFQANIACGNAGKELLPNHIWQLAAAGTTDPGSEGTAPSCNITGGGTHTTGSGTSCVSTWGAQDMIGNLWEWVAEWGTAGAGTSNVEGTEVQLDGPSWSIYNDDTQSNIGGKAYSQIEGMSVAGIVPAVLRGGVSGYGLFSGVFALNALFAPSYSDSNVGFRCGRRR